MTDITGLIRFFQSGGVFMYPLLFILAVGTAIVIERFLVFMRARVNAPQLWEGLSPILLTRQFDEGLRNCYGPRFNTPLHHVLGAGIKGMKKGQNREGLQGVLDAAVLEVTPKLEARLHYLPNLANVATLLGLLGTIIGLIEAFTAVAVADPSQKAALLAKGISMAMNTTAFGLVVAIPLVLVYTYLQSRSDRIIDAIDEYALKLLNLSGHMNQETIVQQRPSTEKKSAKTPRWSGKEMKAAVGMSHVK
ncbi:MAG: MotA/TolQ/ExbB proton channel family protein [Nitrospiria bacterium]